MQVREPGKPEVQLSPSVKAGDPEEPLGNSQSEVKGQRTWVSMSRREDVSWFPEEQETNSLFLSLLGSSLDWPGPA